MQRAKYISNGTITYKITGDQGPQGPKGDTGKSAYQIAVDNGYNGTESAWLATLNADLNELHQRIVGDFSELYSPNTVHSIREKYGMVISSAELTSDTQYYASYVTVNIEQIRNKKFFVRYKNLTNKDVDTTGGVIVTTNTWGSTSKLVVFTNDRLTAKANEIVTVECDMTDPSVANKFSSVTGNVRIMLANRGGKIGSYKFAWCAYFEEDVFANAFIRNAENSVNAEHAFNADYAINAENAANATEFINMISEIKDTNNILNWQDNSLIQENAVLNPDGTTRESTGNMVVTVPVQDISKTYEVVQFDSNKNVWECKATRVFMYDVNMNCLGILLNNVSSTFNITNSSCRYIKFYMEDIRSTNKKYAMVIAVDNFINYTDTFIHYRKQAIIKPECIDTSAIMSKWADKNVVYFGDSITAQGNTMQGGYPFFVSKEIPFANNYCRGVGGQFYMWNDGGWYCKKNGDGGYINRYKAVDGSISTANGQTNIGSTSDAEIQAIQDVLGYEIELHRGCFCSWDRIKAMIPSSIRNTIDLVILMGGTNDHSAVEETPSDENIGGTVEWSATNITDTDWKNDTTFYNGGDFDVTTFVGAIASTIMKMQTWCPNAVVVLATPFSRWDVGTHAQYKNSHGITLRDVSNIEIDVARYMDIPYMDINSQSGVNAWNYTKYVSDGVHPNTEGQKMLARAVANGIISIVPIIN